MSEQTYPVTRDLLRPLVEQPEPSVDGEWFVVPLQSLIVEGYTHVEIHFDEDAKRPNDASLMKCPAED